VAVEGLNKDGKPTLLGEPTEVRVVEGDLQSILALKHCIHVSLAAVVGFFSLII